MNQKLTFSPPSSKMKKKHHKQKDATKSSQSHSKKIANKTKQFLDSLKLGNSRSYPVIKK